jgi:threonine synthase
MYRLLDFVSQREVKASNYVFTGAENPWEVQMDLQLIRSKVNQEYFRKSPPCASKYLPFMPIRDYAKFVSLDEGGTPLIRSKHLGPKYGVDLWFKLESQNPTGSFKDRGSAVDLTIARELGAKAIVLASTGNMAASCSCYAAAAKMPCYVFVPEGTPASKLSQVIAFGGKIVQVKGSYNDAARLAQQVAEELGYYLAGDYAFRVEGQKTAAFEILDQSFFRVPDAVLVPIGCGTNMAAYAKGFDEYKALGFVDRVPQLIGVQAAGSSNVVRSWQANMCTIDPLRSLDTIASAIAVTYPLDGLKALKAIRDTKGIALEVNDREMLEAQYTLSKEEGLFIEVSSASSIAALLKGIAQGHFKGQHVVCVLTGDGLKDPGAILRVALRPPSIYPQVENFMALHRQDFFAGESVAFFDRATTVFSEEPTLAEVRAKARELFHAGYSDECLQHVRETSARFLKKGKPVSASDFQDILQDALELSRKQTAKIFSVLDFEIRAGKDTPSNAKVLIEVGGERREASASGVGPVDAVINALRAAIGPSIEFSLVGFKVGIRSEGPDAVVNVEMRLSRNNLPSVGTGTSPDVIQASIEAFQEAYNGLFGAVPEANQGQVSAEPKRAA